MCVYIYIYIYIYRYIDIGASKKNYNIVKVIVKKWNFHIF